MPYFLGQCSLSKSIQPHRDLIALTVLSMLANKDDSNKYQVSHMSDFDNDCGGFCMVYTEITSFKKGIVRFQSAWWVALSNSDVTIYPGQKVRVAAIQGSVLLIELC